MVSSNAKAGSQKSTPSGSKYRVPAASFTSLEITSPKRLAGAKSSACELAHNRDSFIRTCRGLTSRLSPRSTIHASSPIRLRFVGWRAAKMRRSLWRTKRGAVARPRCFDYLGFRSFLSKYSVAISSPMMAATILRRLPAFLRRCKIHWMICAQTMTSAADAAMMKLAKVPEIKTATSSN